MVHLIPVSKTISFTPIKKRFLSAAAVGWGLSTTQNQTAAAAFFRNWLVLPRCDEWTSSSQDWQCCCREECGWHWRTAYRLVVFKEIDAGKPFSLASTACKAPMRATIRNFWLPCRLLGNTVPIRLLEEGNWSSAGLSSHCCFFCYDTSLHHMEQTEQHYKRGAPEWCFPGRNCKSGVWPRPIPTALELLLLWPLQQVSGYQASPPPGCVRTRSSSA